MQRAGRKPKGQPGALAQARTWWCAAIECKKGAPKAEEERWVIDEQIWMKENCLCLTGIKIAIVVVGTSVMIGVTIDIVVDV
jgi:hypothetical protein